MKVRFELRSFGIDTSQKQIIDYHGNKLVTATLENILSLISSKYLYNEFETINIHHTCFSNITSGYRKYLDFLSDKGIILINESYKKGDHSKSYLFTDFFKEYATVKSFKVDSKEYLKEEENTSEIDKMVLEKLRKDFNCVMIKPEPVQKEIRFVKDEKSIVKFRKYLLNEYGLYKLRNTPRSLHWKSGRIYSPFVQLSKGVRRDYLYFDKQLTSLDIKRSFPLWLAVWLADKDIAIDFETNSFLSSVLSGNIYYDLAEKFNANKNLFNNTEFEKPYINKDKVKTLFGEWLNGNNNLNTLSNLIFRTYYPLVFDFVMKFKNGDKKRMYQELVKMEADFIFNKVCKRLYNEIPGIKLLTCHDEIYFEECYYQDVLSIWNMELEKVYSLIPVNNVAEFAFDDINLEVLGIYVV